jgi:hypothetical protein
MWTDEEEFMVQFMAPTAHATDSSFARWAVLHANAADFDLLDVRLYRIMKKLPWNVLTF